MSANLKSLIGRLNDTCRNALEGAAGLCLSRTNYDVDLEHLLVKLGETPDTDFHRILRRFEIDEGRLAKDLVRSLDRLKTGNSRTPAISPRVPRLLEEAWISGSIDFGAAKIRSAHILLALLEKDEFARFAREISREFAAISVETLRKELDKIVSGSAEDRDAAALGEAPAGDAAGPATGVPGRTKALDQFTIDLTARARTGKLDPVLGRDFEIRQIIDILTRRRQNNPILTGEAGVGKTAVVEGFALRIAQGDVPRPLKNVAVRTLDLGLLQAGAGIKGEFENRLKSVIDEVKASPQPIILFIDEAHTMIGAGGQAGQGDAANLLKPALARGELRTIAATTWAEYKKYFEKDAALARRFQVVKVEEPTEAVGVVMMRGLLGAAREAPQGADPRRGRRGRRAALAPLHLGPAAARQVRQRPRHGLRPGGDRPGRDAARGGGLPPRTHRPLHGRDRGPRARGGRRAPTTRSGSPSSPTKKAAEEEKLAVLEARWEKERELVEKIRDIRSKLEELAAAEKEGRRRSEAVHPPQPLQPLRRRLRRPRDRPRTRLPSERSWTP